MRILFIAGKMLCHFSIILLRREYVFVSDISAKTLSQYRLTKVKECYLAGQDLEGYFMDLLGGMSDV